MGSSGRNSYGRQASHRGESAPSELPKTVRVASSGRSGRCGRPQNCPQRGAAVGGPPRRHRSSTLFFFVVAFRDLLGPLAPAAGPASQFKSKRLPGKQLEPRSSIIDSRVLRPFRALSSLLVPTAGPASKFKSKRSSGKKHLEPRSSILDSRLFLPCWKGWGRDVREGASPSPIQDGIRGLDETVPDRQDSWPGRWAARSEDGAVESCRGRGGW